MNSGKGNSPGFKPYDLYKAKKSSLEGRHVHVYLKQRTVVISTCSPLNGGKTQQTYPR